jgi:predicted amidophosphoribosyltransferase
MFCSNCGEKLDDGTKFCTNCGTKIEGDAPLVHGGATVNPVGPEDNTVLMEYTLNNNYFSVTDTNGKIITAGDMFKSSKSGTAGAVVGALLGIGAGLGAAQMAANWVIKVQIYKSKICFTKLNMLLRPTENRIEINGNEITSVTKTNKAELTVGTRGSGTFVFAAPKKTCDDAVNLLLKLSGAK